MGGISKRTLAVLASLAGCVAVIAAIALLSPTGAARPGDGAMAAFRSDSELATFLASRVRVLDSKYDFVLSEAPPADAPTSASKPSADGVLGMISPSPGDRITNTQEAAVDEGDIVKARGDLLIILRRGRLFTVSVAGGAMKPVGRIDAFPPGADPDAWYDEMLVAGDRIAVVGYSYARGGTEINRFRLSPDGALSFIDSHQLRSADYYSSRNYASRLIGSRMIFYSELPTGDAKDPLAALPGLRRWTPGAEKGEFRRIAASARVYAPPQVRAATGTIDSIHTVTTCDLLAERFDCQATAVLGPTSRSFYVSGRAVYLWVHDGRDERRKAPADVLYRMPLDGGPPSAIQVAGAPIDQFSFRESPDGTRLHVLVADEGRGDGMWGPEQTVPPVSVKLLALPLDALNDGSAVAGQDRYQTLPSPGAGWAMHDRFVGDYLLYGLGADWSERKTDSRQLMAALLDGGPVTPVTLPHGVDRIEVMGPDAVVVGSTDDAVWFSTIRLAGGVAAGDRYRLGGASEAESRSHGFFYRPDSADGTQGVVGLPISRPARPAYHQLFENSAAMVFLRRADRRFQPLGQLAASDEGIADDGCIASCVDWYGNARPIFLRGRVFALMGYELVEGDLQGPKVREIGRVSFAPPPAPTRD